MLCFHLLFYYYYYYYFFLCTTDHPQSINTTDQHTINTNGWTQQIKNPTNTRSMANPQPTANPTTTTVSQTHNLQQLPTTHDKPSHNHSNPKTPPTTTVNPQKSQTQNNQKIKRDQIWSARSRAQRDHRKAHLELLTTASQIRSARSPIQHDLAKLIAKPRHHREAYCERDQKLMWPLRIPPRGTSSETAREIGTMSYADEREGVDSESWVQMKERNFFFFIKQNHWIHNTKNENIKKIFSKC